MVKKLVLFLVMLASASALAQAPARVRGAITAVDGSGFTVDGKTQVLVGEKTEILFTQPIALAEIKPGDFRPFDGRDDQTMTNATVGAQLVRGAQVSVTMDEDRMAKRLQVSPPK